MRFSEGVIHLPRPLNRFVAAAAAAVLAVVVVAGCSGGSSGPQAQDTRAPVRIASYDFTENQVIAELYAQALRRAGIPVKIEPGLGTREIVEPALEQGQIDFVVDYLGTALDFLVPGTTLNHGRAESVHAALRQQFASRGIAVLPFAAAEDQNGFAVTAKFADERHVGLLSDLVPLSRSLVLGGPPECPTRHYCASGLKKVYGLDFRAFRAMPTRAATATALTIGEIDVGMLETTDPRLDGDQLVLLRDDRGLQPRENIVPLVRQAILGTYGDSIADAIAPVTAALTTRELIKLNHAVEVERQTPAAAAEAWLQRQPTRQPTST